MFSLAPDHVWYLSLQPATTGRCRIRYGVAFAPEVLEGRRDRRRFLRRMLDMLERVQEEDRRVVEGIHEGARAPLSTPGPLSWLERENHEFTRYLARILTPPRRRGRTTGVARREAAAG